MLADQSLDGFRRAGLALLDEFLHLLRGQRVEAGRGVGEHQARHALRMAQGEVARDAPAHGQPDEMRLLRLEVVEDPQQILGERGEIQGPGVVVRVAVAARIPGRRPETRGEDRQLLVPVMAVAADAVQENHQRPAAVDAQRDARSRADVDRFHGYSALAPEIFTARPRLSLSVLMYSTKASGELPTGS